MARRGRVGATSKVFDSIASPRFTLAVSCPDCRAARVFDLAYEARVQRRRSMIAGAIAFVAFLTIALMFDQHTYVVTELALGLAKVTIIIAGAAAAIFGAIAFGKQRASESLAAIDRRGDAVPYRSAERCARHAASAPV